MIRTAIALTLLGVTLNCAAEDTVDHLRRLAGRFEYLCIGDILYARKHCSGMVPRQMASAHEDARAELTGIEADAAALRLCLLDENPRVRTLALALLFEREKMQALSAFGAHLDDDAAAFPEPPMSSLPIFDERVDPRTWRTRKVSEFASRFADAYLSGTATSRVSADTIGWYVSAHARRAWSFSQFRVDAARASEGVAEPRDAKFCDASSTLRAEIDRLPRRERAVALLMLVLETGGFCAVAESEVVQIAKTLDRDERLALAEKTLKTDDPDAVFENPAYASARVLVLRHATELFEQADAPRLARMPDGYARLAAARLQRDVVALRAEYARASDDTRRRNDLLTAMIEGGGAAAVPFVRDEYLRDSEGKYGMLMSVLLDEMRKNDSTVLRTPPGGARGGSPLRSDSVARTGVVRSAREPLAWRAGTVGARPRLQLPDG